MRKGSKNFRLTPIRKSILLLIKDHKTLESIASALKVSRQTISYHIRKLIENDYIREGLKAHHHGFYYSSASLPFLNTGKQRKIEDYHRMGDSSATDDKDQSKIRLHGVHIKYLLEDPLPQKILDRVVSLRKFPVKPIRMKGHTDYSIRFGSLFQNATGIIRTLSFTIEGLQLEIPPGIPVEDADNWYMENISEIVQNIEARLRSTIPEFRLKRSSSNMIIGSVIQRHLAFVNHPIAQGVPEGAKLIIRDPVDNKTRIIVDRSLGPPELETQHSKFSLEDMKHIQKNTWTLANNDLTEVFQKTDEEFKLRDSTWNDRFDRISTVLERFAGLTGGINP